MAERGTNVWVWIGLMWSSRVRLVLDQYGDQITDISLFGWSVAADGTLTETFDPTRLDEYRAKWPHIRFWGALRNMDDPDNGPRAIFDALRSSTTARNRLADQVQSKIFQKYPYMHGVDIDLESGGDTRSAESEEIFRVVANRAHSLGKKASAALPPLTSTGSVGGENWVRYRQLGQILDHVSIMSYDFAWRGSAPGPSSPGYWLIDVYNWASKQITPSKISMGLPLYSNFWEISDYPDHPQGWRGNSGTYYAAWQHFTGYRANDGSDANPAGSGDFHRIGWIVYRHAESQFAWGFLDCYDWIPSRLYEDVKGLYFETFQGKDYMVKYGQPSGVPLGTIADNGPRDAYSVYEMEPRRVRSREGYLVQPKTGYALTIDLLQRFPVAATIIDDYATSEQQLRDVYTQTGWKFWSQSASSSYKQYRGKGDLDFWKDFGSQSIYVQARFQFTTSGTFTIRARGVSATVTSGGTITLRRGTTTLGTTSVGAIPTGGDPGDPSRRVIGLRVRDGSARVYWSNAETNIPRVMEEKFSGGVPGGKPGFSASSTVWIDHTYLGDGWWYQPREAVQAKVNGKTATLGRIPRNDITWHSTIPNTFKPNTDIDEFETRDRTISLDWEFGHWNPAPFITDKPQEVRIIPLDHDVWIGNLMVLDAKRSNIVYFSDQETIAYWRARAANDWNLTGIALWTVGQEDVRLWDSLGNGLLEAGTRIVNG